MGDQQRPAAYDNLFELDTMAASPPGLHLLPKLIACAFVSTFAFNVTAHAGPAPAAGADVEPSADASGTIVITGQRLDKTDGVTVLDEAALARQGVTDMQNMARYAPLVSVPGAASGSGNVWDGAGNTGFNIRGVEGNRVGLELDGIELPEAAPKPDASTLNSFGVGRDYFDPETFRSVTIVSGTAPAGAGAQGLGGNVSFVTKAPEDYVSADKPLYADYKFGYDGSNEMRMHALTGATQSGMLQALAVLVHRDGRQMESKGSAPLNPDDWDSDALLAKLAWAPWTGHRFTATIDAFRSRHDREYRNKQGASYPDGSTMESRIRRDRASIDHSYIGAGTPFDSLESRLYVQDSSTEDSTLARYITGNQPTLRDIYTAFDNRSVGFASNASKRLGAHALAYGVSVEQVDTSRPWREDRLIVASGAHQVTSKNRMADMESLKFAAFVRAELALADWFSATPGVRYNWRRLEPNSLENYAIGIPNASRELRKEIDSYATPSLTLSARVAPQLETYLQYSRGTRLPTAAERTGTYDSLSYTAVGNAYAVIGNPNLDRETSKAYELGLKGELARGLRLHAALFETRYKNLIDYALQPNDPVNYPTITFGLYRPENIGHARSWGGELTLDADLGQWSDSLSGARLTLAGGVQRSKARNDKTGMESALASTLPRKSSLIAVWDDPAQRGGAALAVVYVGAKQAAPDPIQGVATPRFAVPSSTVIDLTGYWNIGRHAALTAGIYNLADRKYWDYASVRGLPAATNATTTNDIERLARPGRYAAVTFKLMY